MARILYGVMGEGMGHAARSKEVVDYLVAAGHEVLLVSHDRGLKYLSEFYPVERVSGFNFSYKDNQVQYLPTFFNNFLNSGETVRSLERLSGLVRDRRIDLVISDFEPLSATTAKIKGLPLISLDNQHAITKTKLDYPKNYPSAYVADKMVTRLMIFRAKIYLVLSFFPCQPKNDKVLVFPPIIKREILTAQPKVGDKVLVYLTSGATTVVESLLGQSAEFVVYGLNKTGRQDNLTFKALDRQSFFEDLVGCRAVIATAGFSLISEALYLGKPYLAVPAKLQYEQVLNAYHLAKLGYGQHQDELTSIGVANFLSQADNYRQALRAGIKSGNQEVFAKLQELIEKFA